jgi:hypothetical protein
VIHRCRFGDDEAVGLFRLDEGCVAYPSDREQYLCVHHALRATPLGGMELIEDFSEGKAFTKRWKGAYED